MVSYVFFPSLSYSAPLTNPLPFFLSFCPYAHSENNVLAPALCFPMVLALECVPVKGDIYLLSGREREGLHYCAIQIEGKSRG